MSENDVKFPQYSTGQIREEFRRVSVFVLFLPGHFSPSLAALPAVCSCDYFLFVCSADACLISTEMKTSIPFMQNDALPSGRA